METEARVIGTERSKGYILFIGLSGATDIKHLQAGTDAGATHPLQH